MRGLRVLLAVVCACLFGADAIAQQAAPDLAQIEAAAQGGDADAQFAMALRYHAGEDVLQDYATAAEWLERAVAQGHAPAQNLLGKYLHEGLGQGEDRDRALALLEAAAQEGVPQHLFDLASVLERNAETAVRAADLYKQAADAGLMEAAVSLGVMYQEGIGVEKDLARARALYEPAAAAGHPRAQNNLGLFYVRGEGVPQDYARAAELFTAAAEQGLNRAMTNLGVLYENGFGVPVNEALAAELYRRGGGRAASPSREAQPKSIFAYDVRLAPPDASQEGLTRLQAAAAAGDPVAQFQLGWVLATAPDAAVSAVGQAAQLFQAAAERGHPISMQNLGVLHFEGRGVLQDYVMGYKWLLLAERGGAPDARAVREAYAPRMIAAQINESQRLATAHLEE